jgi:tRNA G37 N-methylase Trm5
MESFIVFYWGNFNMSLPSVLLFAKQVVEGAVKTGEVVVDATVGQGNDTLMLAQLVGEKGKLYGFDIQAEALQIARKKVIENLGSDAIISWNHCSHEIILEAIPREWHGHIAAVMFNLGYLPRFDHTITTLPHSTLTALIGASQLLRSGGVITVVAYTGHDGAQAEADAVERWASLLPQKLFQVLSYRYINQQNNPPFLIVVEKK